MVGKLVDKGKIVVAFGRFNPPTLGHAILVSEVFNTAKNYQCKHEIIVSTTQDNIRNPLSINRKLYYLNKMNNKALFRSTSKQISSLIDFLKVYNLHGFSKLTYVCGFDRLKEFEILINKYNGVDYNFDEIELIESGSLETREQFSATDLRSYIRDDMFIKELFPFEDVEISKQMFNEVRNILNKAEEVI